MLVAVAVTRTVVLTRGARVAQVVEARVAAVVLQVQEL
jgi:hypothetical protein